MQKPAVLAWGSKEQGWNQQAIIWLVSQTTHAYDVLERWLFHEILQCSKIENPKQDNIIVFSSIL